jgi:hypothetical protein
MSRIKKQLIIMFAAIVFLVVPASFANATTINFNLNLSSSSLKFNDTLRITPVWVGNSGSYIVSGNTMQTRVNGQVIGNITGVNFHDLQNGKVYQDVSIATQYGFKAGPNVIVVSLGDPQGQPLGSANTSVNVSSGSIGIADTGAACTDDAKCKSNLCWDDGSGNATCQVCTSDSECNSNGDEGFTCSPNGICVNASQAAPPAPAPTGPTVAAAPPVDCSGPNPNPNFCFYNPLPVDSLTETLLLIMRGFLGVVGIWSVAFIIIGGFRYVGSQGNEEQVTAARKTITWAVIGFAIAMLAFSIMAIVQNILQTNIRDVTSKTSGLQVIQRDI